MIETTFKIKTPQGTFDESNYLWIDKFVNPIEATVKNVVNESDLTHIAEIIRKDIVSVRIAGGRDIFGGSYHPLSPGTVKKKGHSRPLIDTGALQNSIEVESGKDFRKIYVGGNRTEIAEYLQYGTRKMDPFPFFGISNEALKEIDDYLNKIQKEKLDA